MTKEQNALVPSERSSKVEGSVIEYYFVDGELHHIEWTSERGSVMAINVDKNPRFPVSEDARKNARVITRKEFDDILQGR